MKWCIHRVGAHKIEIARSIPTRNGFCISTNFSFRSVCRCESPHRGRRTLSSPGCYNRHLIVIITHRREYIHHPAVERRGGLGSDTSLTWGKRPMAIPSSGMLQTEAYRIYLYQT